MLSKIVAAKQHEVVSLPHVDLSSLPKASKCLVSSLRSARLPVIAELKSKSPSEGVICEPYDPVAIAKNYLAAGVAGISVLTDGPFFGGSFDHLKAVSALSPQPVLCKDFIIDNRQVAQARLAGASACLLIVRILSDEQLHQLYDSIVGLDMTALVEVFDESDIARIQTLKPELVGINNRNLDSLAMDTARAGQLKNLLPEDTMALSLSGVKTPSDITEALKVNEGVLVGTALMRCGDPIAFLNF